MSTKICSSCGEEKDLSNFYKRSDSNDGQEDLYKLNHYTNLQPLCSKINRDVKRHRVDY